METVEKKLFIVDDNLLWTISLKKYLKERFGKRINISTFNDGWSCIQKLGDKPDIILMDYELDPTKHAKNGIDYLKAIKAVSPDTTVFLVTAKKNLPILTSSFLFGAKEYIAKDGDPWNKVFSHIGRSVGKLYGIFLEWPVFKYLLMILFAVAILGIAVYLCMKFLF